MLDNVITGLVASESTWDVFVGRTLEQLNLLLTAPLHEPELIWVMIPLIFTLLVMTFYFGMYRKEEMGWNTALGNSIVLMFVTLDLLRQIYHYTPIPNMINFMNYPFHTSMVLIILIEAVILAMFAFYHVLPKKVMYFVASPLPVNLQAYIVLAIVYTRFLPNWYMVSAGVIAFVLLWCTLMLLKLGENYLLHRLHISKLNDAKQLRLEAVEAKKVAKKLKGEEKSVVLHKARKNLLEAKNIEEEVISAEKIETGEIEVIDFIKAIRKMGTGKLKPKVEAKKKLAKMFS